MTVLDCYDPRPASTRFDAVRALRIQALTLHLRSYDLLIRFGGDEFLCGLMGLTTAQVAERLALVKVDLAANAQASITVGLTELEGNDRVEDLIGRADAAMYEERTARGSKASVAAKAAAS